MISIEQQQKNQKLIILIKIILTMRVCNMK